MSPLTEIASGRWTAWSASWGTALAASLAGAFTLATLSADALQVSLEQALGQHLLAEAGVIGASLRTTPVDAIVAMGGDRSAAELRERLGALGRAAQLRDVGLLAPGRSLAVTQKEGRRWLAAEADADLIRASLESPHDGPLYRAEDGALYRTAYAPLLEHPGWVVGVEGSGATLAAVDALRRLQLRAGLGVVAVTSLVAGALAAALVRPLTRLDRQLSTSAPGDDPAAIGVAGPREVRRVALAARKLLGAIRDRDAALHASHQAQIDQLTQMGASVAHEVRNPLNALSLVFERLAADPEAPRRAVLVSRGVGCLAEIEGTVARFLEISRPIEPRCGPVDVLGLARGVAAEMAERLAIRVEPDTPVSFPTDPDLLRAVLRNLLANAAQAGAVAASVRLRVGERLEVDVVDDGPGVHPDEAERIFQWFHTTRASGHGIGLPFSRRIAEALGGGLELIDLRPATFRLSVGPGRPG
jgi:signal transduction histidine kinase